MMEGSSMGYLDLPYTQEPAVFPRITHISEVKPSHESHAVISRRKRNILFPSGVKLCAQETTEQVIANHLSYFHLRGKTQCEPVLKMNIVNGVFIVTVTPRCEDGTKKNKQADFERLPPLYLPLCVSTV